MKRRLTEAIWTIGWWLAVALFVWGMLSLINGDPWNPLTGLLPAEPAYVQRPLGWYCR